MRDVRIWFKKDGISRFISHLDLSRCMTRMIHRQKIPIWYTEGFNPHPFITFALPLSLGIRGLRESMDIKLKDDFNFDTIIDNMNRSLPTGIQITDISKPIMSPSEISYAKFSIYFESDKIKATELLVQIDSIINKPEIIVTKKTKSGLKETDIKGYIKDFYSEEFGQGVKLQVTLPAGNKVNINPGLIIDAIYKYYGTEGYSDITREKLYNYDMEEFK